MLTQGISEVTFCDLSRMFTGIITDIGSLRSLRQEGGRLHLTIATSYDPAGIALGASIACHGICLTVVDKGADWFAVEASEETQAVTTIGEWQEGMRLNLERSLKLGDEMGGHLVSGHVDGVAMIEERFERGGSTEFRLWAPKELMDFIAQKGSVTLDGVSLTVTEADDESFAVSLIPHTLAVTTWRTSKVAQRVNLEVDQLARYAARLQGR